ncbi:MAG: hypothetical protein SV375_17785 [Thermodesulfobacteriota bacterium]|nr:hypothetical protein [Thermodesulfobacteriota bacterium]
MILKRRFRGISGCPGGNGRKGEFWIQQGNRRYEGLVKAGIIDHTRVGRFAFHNVISAAVLFMITEAMVAEKPNRKKKATTEMPSEDMF